GRGPRAQARTDASRLAGRDPGTRHRSRRDRQHLRTEGGHTMTFISRRDLLKRAAVVGAAAAVPPMHDGSEGPVLRDHGGLHDGAVDHSAVMAAREPLENLTATEADL